MADPVEEAAPLERVVQLARAVRGQDHGRAAARADRADLRDRDLEVREHLEQERFELVVGAVDLVDQQHDRLRRSRSPRSSGPPDQELGAEELLLGHRPLLRGADVEELARVVPLVHRVCDVEALVALQADQPRERRARRAPSPPRSCRHPPRPRAAAASRVRARGTARSRGPGRAGTRAPGGRPRARRSSRTPHLSR